MICVKTLYLGLNRLLLLAIGAWPYERSKLVRLQLILLYSILASFIVFQFITLTTSKCTPEFAIELISVISFFLTYLIKYNMLCFNMDTVKNLLELIQHIYDGLRDKSEIAIIEKYGIIARRHTDVLMLFAVSSMFTLVFPQLWPCILNIVLSVNESQPRSLLFITTEYFIDQEKYFYLIMLHMNAAFLIGGVAMFAAGTMFLVYLQYACGMFEIASYRMERALTGSPVNENSAYKKIIHSVDIHRNAVGLTQSFMSKFNLSYFILLSTGMISLSFNLFRIYREMSSGFNVKKLISPFMFLSIHYLYLFVANNCAQQITDYNNSYFDTVYNVEWYTAPLRIQKMTLFLLQRGTKICRMKFGGVIVGSLESAATLTSASISYFAVLSSMRQV